MNHWIMAPLLLPLLAGLLNLLLVDRGLRLQRTISLGSTAALLAVATYLLNLAGKGGILTYELGDWAPPFGIVLVLDRLSALLVLLTAVVALLSLLYAVNSEDQRGRDFHVLFPLQLVGINGAFLTGDLFNLFVFFEILLIASYGLALYGMGAERTRAGLHYVVLNLVGSGLFLIAVGTLYAVTGTLNMADLAVKVAASTPDQSILLRTSALLLLVVFGLKAALLPLHLWLPALYGNAVAPVAALFAIMTKVGVYAILRTYTLIFPGGGPVTDVSDGWLFPLALLTLVVGAVGMLGSQRLRNLVGYLVVMSVGTLLAGIGLFNIRGITAALYYLPHSTLITAGMFLLADLIARQRGPASDHIAPGAPLFQPTRMGVLFLLGAVAAVGMPPLSGFLGKLLLLKAAAPEQAVWLWTIILAGSLAGLIALSRAGSRIFWNTEGEHATSEGANLHCIAPAALLLGTGVLMTIFAAPLTRYAESTAAQLLSPQQYINAVLEQEIHP